MTYVISAILLVALIVLVRLSLRILVLILTNPLFWLMVVAAVFISALL